MNKSKEQQQTIFFFNFGAFKTKRSVRSLEIVVVELVGIEVRCQYGVGRVRSVEVTSDAAIVVGVVVAVERLLVVDAVRHRRPYARVGRRVERCLVLISSMKKKELTLTGIVDVTNRWGWFTFGFCCLAYCFLSFRLMTRNRSCRHRVPEQIKLKGKACVSKKRKDPVYLFHGRRAAEPNRHGIAGWLGTLAHDSAKFLVHRFGCLGDISTRL